MAEPTPDRCRRCARVVPWFSFWGNLALAIYKLIVGIFGGSTALVADAFHSFADVVGSTGILVATRISSREPDDAYPYGRGKAEFIGAVFVYTVLFFFSVGIIVGAVHDIGTGSTEPPHFITLLGAVVSVLYNLVMYRYATCAGMRNNSPAILADAFENRTDALSSAACVGGIAAAMFIHPVCDPIAALVVGGVIMWNCQEQLREAARGLMDGGLEADEVAVIRRVVARHRGVTDVAYVRSRQTGARFWLDIGVQVPGTTGVREADGIVAGIQSELLRRPNYHHVEVFVLPGGEKSPRRAKARTMARG